MKGGTGMIRAYLNTCRKLVSNPRFKSRLTCFRLQLYISTIYSLNRNLNKCLPYVYPERL